MSLGDRQLDLNVSAWGLVAVLDRERVPGTTKSVSRGVKVEVGETQTAIDLEIIIDYGVSITDVAGVVRESVISAVEWMTGLEVVEVNIAVSDVKLPDEEDEEEEQPRLR